LLFETRQAEPSIFDEFLRQHHSNEGTVAAPTPRSSRSSTRCGPRPDLARWAP
jgi:hypothetical protein